MKSNYIFLLSILISYPLKGAEYQEASKGEEAFVGRKTRCTPVNWKRCFCCPCLGVLYLLRCCKYGQCCKRASEDKEIAAPVR